MSRVFAQFLGVGLRIHARKVEPKQAEPKAEAREGRTSAKAEGSAPPEPSGRPAPPGERAGGRAAAAAAAEPPAPGRRGGARVRSEVNNFEK